MEPGRHDPVRRHGRALHRVSENGGSVRPATVLDESRRRTRALVSRVPAGRTAVPVSGGQAAAPAARQLFQGSLDSTETRRVFASEANVGVAGRYLMSLNKGVLMAQRVQSGSGGRDRRPDRDRRSHPFGSATPLGWPLLGGRAAWSPTGARARTAASSGSIAPDGQLDSFPAAGDYHHPGCLPTRSRCSSRRRTRRPGATRSGSSIFARHLVPADRRSVRRAPRRSGHQTVSGSCSRRIGLAGSPCS